MKFALSGLDEALEKVALIAAAVVDRSVEEDALEALAPVVADARALAPVDRGDLRDSIEPIVFEDGTVGVIIGDWKGHFFEFGTVNMRAQPMLAPAFDGNRDIVIERLGNRVGARIEKAI